MKNMTFKKSAASIAVAAALGALGTSVQAVNLANDGIGQVVLFPFYTVNGDYDNYLNVTNTSADTVAFKVRFRESYNSQDVRDFNVVLSPYDVWTGVVTLSDDGTVGTIRTKDKSCTSPKLPDAGNGWFGIDFTNIAYAQDPATLDGGNPFPGRTKEGHYEVIEMGIANNTPDGIKIALAALHAGGAGLNTQVPPVTNIPLSTDPVTGVITPSLDSEVCGFFHNWTSNFNAEVMLEGLDAPENNLKANATLINVGNGNATGMDPTILANFQTLIPISRRPRDERPNYIDANALSFVTIDDPATSLALATTTGLGGDSLFDIHVDGPEAVSAVLARASVVNEFVSRPGAESEWVVTFPTKRYFVDPKVGKIGDIEPFANTFTNKSCDAFEFTLTDREEFRFTPEGEDEPFSPPPPNPVVNASYLCYETNTIAFSNTDVVDPVVPGGDLLASPLVFGIVTKTVGSNGWVDMNLEVTDAGVAASQQIDDVTGFESLGGIYYGGLPTIGFLVKSLVNGVTDENLRSYMMSWEHGYRRTISATAP